MEPMWNFPRCEYIKSNVLNNIFCVRMTVYINSVYEYMLKLSDNKKSLWIKLMSTTEKNIKMNHRFKRKWLSYIYQNSQGLEERKKPYVVGSEKKYLLDFSPKNGYKHLFTAWSFLMRMCVIFLCSKHINIQMIILIPWYVSPSKWYE